MCMGAGRGQEEGEGRGQGAAGERREAVGAVKSTSSLWPVSWSPSGVPSADGGSHAARAGLCMSVLAGAGVRSWCCMVSSGYSWGCMVVTEAGSRDSRRGGGSGRRGPPGVPDLLLPVCVPVCLLVPSGGSWGLVCCGDRCRVVWRAQAGRDSGRGRRGGGSLVSLGCPVVPVYFLEAPGCLGRLGVVAWCAGPAGSGVGPGWPLGLGCWGGPGCPLVVGAPGGGLGGATAPAPWGGGGVCQ